MNRMPMVLRFGLAALLAISGSVAAQDGAQRESAGRARKLLLAQLSSSLDKQMWRAQRQLKAERAETIWALMELARSEGEEPLQSFRRSEAIKLLGEYRAVEARELLVDQVDYCTRVVVFSDHPLNGFIAAQAIAKIGEPAVQLLLSRGLNERVSDNELKVRTLVICEHHGSAESDVGLYRIRRCLERARAKREASNEQYGSNRGPTLYEKNLARMIEIYQKIEAHAPDAWPLPSQGG